jgi:hypothetical protein
MDGKLDEGSARLLLDSAPSKVISNEMTVSSLLSLLFSICIYIKVIALRLSRLNFFHLFKNIWHFSGASEVLIGIYGL